LAVHSSSSIFNYILGVGVMVVVLENINDIELYINKQVEKFVECEDARAAYEALLVKIFYMGAKLQQTGSVEVEV